MSYKGQQKKDNYQTEELKSSNQETCSDCKGSGADIDGETCSSCNGEGSL